MFDQIRQYKDDDDGQQFVFEAGRRAAKGEVHTLSWAGCPIVIISHS